MRVVLDTNILLSALISHDSPPAHIYRAWRNGAFDLVTASVQLDELRRASRYPRLRAVLEPHRVGRMINHLHGAIVLGSVPPLHEAADPNDSWLLSLADTARADFLVTGDKRAGILGRGSVGSAQIVTAAMFSKRFD
jgi:putative PIN family toxin of toxin-antitoxin system